MKASYADLEIGLRHYDAERYAVELRFYDPASEADIRPARNVPPLAHFDLARLKELALDPQAYGSALTEGLFADRDVTAVYARALGLADSLDPPAPLRLRLAIGIDSPELHPLQWETLRDPQDGTFLSLSDRVLFSRYLGSGDWRLVRIKRQGDLRALVVVPAPTDLAAYGLADVDPDAELARARAGLQAIPITALLGREATPARLASEIAQGYDILYLVLHGAFERGEARLWMAGEDGASAVTAGSDLVAPLRNLAELPRLVVVASCQSAAADSADALNAFGPRLAEAGIPAVLAMNGSISMATAASFVAGLFKELRRDGQVDRAVSAARRAVQNQPDAWMPVLFTRLRTGRIWYTPGFAGDPLGFKKWPALLNNIEQGHCTPILGAGLLEPILGSTREVARRWAETYGFPLQPHEREDLPQVAQFLAIDQDQALPRDKLGEYLRLETARRFGDRLPPELRKAGPGSLDPLIEAVSEILREPDEPHEVLAGLPFTVYITTNPDSLLESALRAAHKEPQVVLCPWNDYVERKQDAYDEEPTVERPLVYHLFGHLSAPESLVITEDDYFEFLTGVTRNSHLIPDAVQEALVDRSLLFLGFHIDDWAFRVLFRSLMSYEGRVRRNKYVHIAVQITPEEGQMIQPERAREYLEQYFSAPNDARQQPRISIFWGNTADFVRALVPRWRENHPSDAAGPAGDEGRRQVSVRAGQGAGERQA